MADPYQIQGALPWSSGAASMDFTGSPAGLSNSYANAYNSSLGMNQANYNNIFQGFQGTMAAQQAAQQGVQQGYGNLSGDVLAGLSGIGASRSQDIASEYAKQSGAAAQSLISRGLGNSTIQDSVQRGLAFDKGRQDTALAGQMADLRAGYQSRLGLAGLGYAGQAAAQNTDQANRQLGFMNSVSAGYPDASLYSRLAQMWGAGQQGAADRAQQQDALQQLRFGGQITPRGTTSYSPGGTALTGRPTPGAFGGGPGGGAGAGGTGATYASPGNYLGLGTPVAVGGAAPGEAAYATDPGAYDAGGGYAASGYADPGYQYGTDPGPSWFDQTFADAGYGVGGSLAGVAAPPFTSYDNPLFDAGGY